MTDTTISAFDGHNDVLFRLYGHGGAAGIPGFLNGGDGGHLDLPRAKQGGLVGGLFAIYPPSPSSTSFMSAMTGSGYDLPLPEPLSLADGQAPTLKQASIFFQIAAASNGAFAICRSVDEIRAANARGAFAAVLHIEGAEGIDPGLDMLEVLYAAGLRSIGPVWSRPNIFGHGVPMRYPSTGDTGPGLTDAGRDLVQACNRLGVLIDLSHLNEKGFWDVAALSDAPLVATHSNVHSISPVARNLSDKQMDAIKASGGVAGINFATAFLRPDGQMNTQTGLDIMLRHVDAMLERLGEDGVVLGSDYDGAVIPDDLSDVSKLPNLWNAMREHGYSETLIRKIAYGNWMGVLERIWK